MPRLRWGASTRAHQSIFFVAWICRDDVGPSSSSCFSSFVPPVDRLCLEVPTLFFLWLLAGPPLSMFQCRPCGGARSLVDCRSRLCLSFLVPGQSRRYSKRATDGPLTLAPSPSGVATWFCRLSTDSVALRAAPAFQPQYSALFSVFVFLLLFPAGDACKVAAGWGSELVLESRCLARRPAGGVGGGRRGACFALWNEVMRR